MSLDPDRCQEKVSDGWHWRQCSRKPWKNGYCKQHHPDSVKARSEESEKKSQIQRANSPFVKLDEAKKRIKELEFENNELRAKLSEYE